MGWRNGQSKNLNILRMKRTFKMESKAFSIILKGISFIEANKTIIEFSSQDILSNKHSEFISKCRDHNKNMIKKIKYSN